MSLAETLENVLVFAGVLTVIAGLAMFARANSAIIKSKPFLFGVWALVSAAFPVCFALLSGVCAQNTAAVAGRVLGLAAAAILFAVVLNKSLISDYFQPLSLTGRTGSVLITGITTLLTVCALGLLLGTGGILPLLVPVYLIVVMLAGIVWAKTQGWSRFDNIDGQPLFLFRNGDGGYKTFRIPSLIVLDKHSLNEKCGCTFLCDVLLASAEARRNSSKDLGDIDIVGKLSADGGSTWTPLTVLFKAPGGIGKAGNPTPVFDRKNAVIHFVCTFGTRADHYAISTCDTRGRLRADLSIAWEAPVPMGAMVPGPGKSIRLRSGRIVVPGDGHVMFSDDEGMTWQSGNPARGGECEAVELPGGELMMVTRFGPACSKQHPREFQKLSFSADGGENWQRHADTTLKTPMCQSSLDKTSRGTVILTYPDCHLTRANLSAGISEDNGRTWAVKRLYSGPSGYSCVAVDGEDNIFVLAEAGKVNYNEALVFLKIK